MSAADKGALAPSTLDVATLQDLLERVEKAKGRDPGIDGRIAWMLGWRFTGLPDGPNDPLFDDWEDIAGRWVIEGYYDDPPEWSGDLNATIALVKRMLPSIGWSLFCPPADADDHEAQASLFEDIRNVEEGEVDGVGATPALALLSALLDYLIEIEVTVPV